MKVIHIKLCLGIEIVQNCHGPPPSTVSFGLCEYSYMQNYFHQTIPISEVNHEENSIGSTLGMILNNFSKNGKFLKNLYFVLFFPIFV